MKDSISNKFIEQVVSAINIDAQSQAHSRRVLNGLVHDLQSKFPHSNIYFQGSNKLGTVVKPYDRDKRGDYDFDLVIQYVDNKRNITQEQLKNKLGSYLKTSNYRNHIKESRRCWTLNFNEGNASFHIDILPCVDESIDEKQRIIPQDYVSTAIAITNIIDKNVQPYKYDWKSSNPKGFASWFKSTNDCKYSRYINNERNKMKDTNPQLYKDLCSLDIEFTRTPLQKVVQILKRHRDVMYANDPREEFKPISIIITTLVGRIVEANDIVQNNTYDLLNSVLDGLLFYSKLCTEGITSDFDEDFKKRQLITKRMGSDGMIKWVITNPADNRENLADKWCKEPELAKEFFRWVKQAQNDLICILDQKPNDILQSIKVHLGQDVYDAVKDFDFNCDDKPREVKVTPTTPRPYRAYE